MPPQTKTHVKVLGKNFASLFSTWVMRPAPSLQCPFPKMSRGSLYTDELAVYVSVAQVVSLWCLSHHVALDKLKDTKIIIAMYIDVEKAREF